MKKLETAQGAHGINDIYALDEPGPGGARHLYQVVVHGSAGFDSDGNLRMSPDGMLEGIQFQRGPRADDTSIHGVTDADLLEIVRDRLTDFQAGPYPCTETADALRYVTEALLCLRKRTQDRARRGVLGLDEP